jgi:hypothetical protein
MSEHDDIDALRQRVAALESACKEMRAQFKAAAHELRDDSDFMKLSAQSLSDHAVSHWFDKAARKLLWFVLGILGTAGASVVIFLAGRNIK